MNFLEKISKNDRFIDFDPERLENSEVAPAILNFKKLGNEAYYYIARLLKISQFKKIWEEEGFDSLYHWSQEKFGFKERTTRYLVSLVKKLDKVDVPQSEAARIIAHHGWVKTYEFLRISKTPSQLKSVAKNNKNKTEKEVKKEVKRQIRNEKSKKPEASFKHREIIFFDSKEDLDVYLQAKEVVYEKRSDLRNTGQVVEIMASHFLTDALVETSFSIKKKIDDFALAMKKLHNIKLKIEIEDDKKDKAGRFIAS